MAIIDGCCDFLVQKVRVGFSRAALQQRGETVASPQESHAFRQSLLQARSTREMTILACYDNAVVGDGEGGQQDEDKRHHHAVWR